MPSGSNWVRRALADGILALILGEGVFAHHSYVMFDRTKLVKVEASIAKLEWKNPHVWLWVYVPNDKGAYDLYGLETGSVNSLARRGWTLESVKVGEKWTVYLFPLKNGEKGGYFVQAKRTSDGAKLIGDEAAYMQLPGESAPPPQPPKD